MGWIAPHSWISLETARDEAVEPIGFRLETTRPVGKAALHLLRPAP